MRARFARLRLRDESGQAVTMLIIGAGAILIAVGAIVVDVGHAYLVQRKLQSVADAAALAAAQALPSDQAAATAATTYGPGAGGLNKLGDGTAVQQTAAPWCLKSLTYCYGNPSGGAATNGQGNGVVVTETAAVKTTFMKVFGIPTVTMHATATACGMCSSPPRDIALVVDRTGSMADNIADLKQGVDTFLQSLDPTEDYVSLLVLPPAPTGNPCSPAAGATGLPLNYGDSYPSGSDDNYLVVHLSHDYRNTNGTLNQSSTLVKDVNCIAASGSTSYQEALIAAQNELVSHGSGRKGVQRVIVFETDGAANTAPDSYYNSSSGENVNNEKLYSPTSAHASDVDRPCGSTVDYANNTIKPSGTAIYTVGYQLDGDDDCYEAPQITGSHTSRTTHVTTYTGIGYRQQRENLEAGTALSEMASPNPVYQASDGATMSASFGSIASDILGATLVPNSEGQ